MTTKIDRNFPENSVQKFKMLPKLIKPILFGLIILINIQISFQTLKQKSQSEDIPFETSFISASDFSSRRISPDLEFNYQPEVINMNSEAHFEQPNEDNSFLAQKDHSNSLRTSSIFNSLLSSISKVSFHQNEPAESSPNIFNQDEDLLTASSSSENNSSLQLNQDKQTNQEKVLLTSETSTKISISTPETHTQLPPKTIEINLTNLTTNSTQDNSTKISTTEGSVEMNLERAQILSNSTDLNKNSTKVEQQITNSNVTRSSIQIIDNLNENQETNFTLTESTMKSIQSNEKIPESETASSPAPLNRNSGEKIRSLCGSNQSECEFMIATIPVVQKWNDTSNENKTSIVNEFIFMPADSPLEFEETQFTTRKPDSFNQTQDIPAEHRTLDGDLGSLNEELELDYVNSDPDTNKNYTVLVENMPLSKSDFNFGNAFPEFRNSPKNQFDSAKSNPFPANQTTQSTLVTVRVHSSSSNPSMKSTKSTNMPSLLVSMKPPTTTTTTTTSTTTTSTTTTTTTTPQPTTTSTSTTKPITTGRPNRLNQKIMRLTEHLKPTRSTSRKPNIEIGEHHRFFREPETDLRRQPSKMANRQQKSKEEDETSFLARISSSSQLNRLSTLASQNQHGSTINPNVVSTSPLPPVRLSVPSESKSEFRQLTFGRLPVIMNSHHTNAEKNETSFKIKPDMPNEAPSLLVNAGRFNTNNNTQGIQTATISIETSTEPINRSKFLTLSVNQTSKVRSNTEANLKASTNKQTLSFVSSEAKLSKPKMDFGSNQTEANLTKTTRQVQSTQVQAEIQAKSAEPPKTSQVQLQKSSLQQQQQQQQVKPTSMLSLDSLIDQQDEIMTLIASSDVKKDNFQQSSKQPNLLTETAKKVHSNGQSQKHSMKLNEPLKSIDFNAEYSDSKFGKILEELENKSDGKSLPIKQRVKFNSYGNLRSKQDHQLEQINNEKEMRSDLSILSGEFNEDSTATNLAPGRPGIDYPIYWQVPKTTFDCRDYEQSGFYADVESDCQAYHSCHRGRGGRHTFLCPNGTLFSQDLLTCDWWYNVDCSNPTTPTTKLHLT